MIQRRDSPPSRGFAVIGLATLVARIQCRRSALIAAPTIFSAAPYAVGIGGVDEIDAGLEGRRDDPVGLDLAGAVAEHHRAEADRRNLEAAVAQAAVFHLHRVAPCAGAVAAAPWRQPRAVRARRSMLGTGSARRSTVSASHSAARCARADDGLRRHLLVVVVVDVEAVIAAIADAVERADELREVVAVRALARKDAEVRRGRRLLLGRPDLLPHVVGKLDEDRSAADRWPRGRRAGCARPARRTRRRRARGSGNWRETRDRPRRRSRSRCGSTTRP